MTLADDREIDPALAYEKAAEVLVARREPAGLPHLVEALADRYDYIAGTKPRAVGVVARAIGAMGGMALDPAMRGAAVDALLGHLQQPETPSADLVDIVKALGAVGGGAQLAPMRSFLLSYRADPVFSTQLGPVSATIDVLLATGGPGDREVVGFVAADPRSQPSIAEYAARALERTARALAGEAVESE